MSQRLPVTPAPEPLEAYAHCFDSFFAKRNQRDAFRRYLEGLLVPAERNRLLSRTPNRLSVPTIVLPKLSSGSSRSRRGNLRW